MKITYTLLVLIIGTGFCFMNPVSAQETTPTSKPTSRVVEDGGTGTSRHFNNIRPA